jgi:SDR family mycofactocin-dependent oxidoreductase
MNRFKGKTVFITGGARGQGRSHAIRFAEEGADIVTLDICDQIATVEYPMATLDDLDATVKLVEESGRQILAKQADVRDFAAVQDVVTEGIARFGHLDVVVANAGILPVTAATADSLESWHDALDVMLTGVYHTVRASLPPMLERGIGGSIVLISSTAGLRGLSRSPDTATAGLLGYTAAKHGVVGLARAWANALASDNIRVNAVHPTGTNTPMTANEAFAGFAARHPEILDAFTNALPVPMIEAADITNAVLWLCSDEARYVTGISLPVDAGLTNR